MKVIRYGRAGYGLLAALRWRFAWAVWRLRGRPYPGVSVSP